MGGLLEGEKTVAGALSSPDRCQALPTLDVILGLVPLLSGLNLRPLEGHLVLVSGFVRWRVEKPI
ncbi:hypothetical protein ACQZ40_10830, partial [Agrobacterium sp. 16-172Ci]